MAERKSGPVKPPVIDLKAREASEPAPAEDAAAAETPPARTARPKPAAKAAKIATADARPASAAEPEAAAPAAEPKPEPGASAASERKPEPSPATPEPAAAQPQPAATPLPPRPPARLAMPWSAISLAAGAGAVLGALLTYIAANWIALPVRVPEVTDPTPAITALAERATALETQLASVMEAGQSTREGLDTVVTRLDGAVAELRQSIADVRAAIPEVQPVDLSAIEQQLQTLENRIEAVAAGASTEDASALAESLSGIENGLAALTGRIGEAETRLSTTDAGLTAIRSNIEALEAAIAAQNLNVGGTELGPAVQLPLILTGLESAFSRGRPYEAEMRSLLALLPDLDVPDAITANAATGLIRPDALARRFDEAVPNILAGRTGETTGDWTRDAIEWAKAILALRPAEELEGDTPEAIVSRLEAAVERYDFTSAAVLLAQLPAPMRLAAGEIGEAIAAHADAEQFIAALRAQALAPAAEGAN